MTKEIFYTTDNNLIEKIKDKKNKSNIISNFSSKFYNENGKIYAKQICPKCDYYEMPDMVLNQ